VAIKYYSFHIEALMFWAVCYRVVDAPSVQSFEVKIDTLLENMPIKMITLTDLDHGLYQTLTHANSTHIC